MAHKGQRRAFSSCVNLPLRLIVTIFVFVQLSMNVNVEGKIYKSIQWISTNPRFIRGNAEQNCKDDEVLEIRVKVASKMAVLCPTKVMVVDTMEHENPQDSLYENLWIIYDKDSFDNCKIPANDSRKLLTCNDPHSLNYKTIVFNLYSASNTQVAFAKEQYYYFLSTSDGSQLSLNNTKGGHCNDTNLKISMKFRLFVCKEQSSHPNCNQTDFPFGQLRCASTKTPSTTTTSAPLVPSPSTKSSAVTATSTVLSSTPTTTSESAQLPVNQRRIGPSDDDEKDTWLMIAVFFIVLCAVLVVVLAVIVCSRHGKHETCLSDLNRVDCCSSKDQNRYEKQDIGNEEKGMTEEGEYETISPWHNNPGYRGSVITNSRESQAISEPEDGHDNRGFSVEEKQDSEDLVDENTNKKIMTCQNLKQAEKGIEMSNINSIREKGLNKETIKPWSYSDVSNINNTTPAIIRDVVRA